MKKLFSFMLCMILMLPCFGLFAFAGEENAVYVSPDGNDENPGTITKPLATLEGAKKAVKNFEGNVTVYFREGSYTFTKTVIFDASDKSNVTYKAYNGEKVVFTSGTAYTGFEECTVNGVRAFKKDVGTQADFNVLFSSESTLPQTRYPESGYLSIASVSEDYCINPDLEVDANFHKGYTGMYVNTSDIPVLENENDVIVKILHFWKDETLLIKSYDSSTGLMQFHKPSSMTLSEGERYFLLNVKSALNAPGEWYLDKSEGVLYYVPKDGETADTLTLWGSDTDTMIDISGVDGISFENIIFRGNGFKVSDTRDFSQAAYDATSCVSYSNAKDFHISNCEFRDIAACSVFLLGVQNAEVENCLFDNIGAQAVYIRGENAPLDSEGVSKNIKVTNNIISDYGRVYYNAVAILVIHANSVDICDNEIHDGYYTAISVGWVWGFDYNVTYNNKICNNLIYNIGQGWLSDMGGIYTLGVQPGTVISGNVIHNVAADPGEGGYGGWGIYLDEGSSQILVEKNLVYACGSDSYHLHYGNNNTVTNNIFALSGTSQIRVTSNLGRCQDVSPTAEFTKNIILTDGSNLALSHIVKKSSLEENGNIYWSISDGSSVLFSTNDSSDGVMTVSRAEKKGYISNPVIADPLFRDVDNFDFELSDDSPAVAAGFEKWDYSGAGTDAGTVVGIATQGGQTAYNTSSENQNMLRQKPSLLKFSCSLKK